MLPVESAESSWLLLTLAFTVALMSVMAAFGWLRRVQPDMALRTQWRPVLVTAVLIGTGLCSAMLLALGAEGLQFPIGYRSVMVPVLVLGAIGGALPLAALLAWSTRGPVRLLAAAGLAALGGALQVGWVTAAGFRPGPVWQVEFVAAAISVMAIGFGGAMTMGFAGFGRSSRWRLAWRFGGGVLMALSLLAAQDIVITAAGVSTQLGSVYLREISGAMACLVAGVLVPMVLVMLLLDIALKTERRRHRRGPVVEHVGGPPPRRRRRQRFRGL